MNKRLEKLEKEMPDNSANYIRKVLYPKWKEGEDVTKELEKIFENHPGWKHRPPTTVGKLAYIDWKNFSGYNKKR